uniref:Uncharacterized protein n=1 Tax=Canis lupus dingo TaxID=286419 RepID=A0A8C0QV53_CANLU
MAAAVPQWVCTVEQVLSEQLPKNHVIKFLQDHGHKTARTLLPPGVPAPGASRPLRTGSCGCYCRS